MEEKCLILDYILLSFSKSGNRFGDLYWYIFLLCEEEGKVIIMLYMCNLMS